MKSLDDRKVMSFIGGNNQVIEASTKDIRQGEAFRIESYLDLATRVAELQFRNPGYVLLFRGQTKDHRNGGMSTLCPTLFRNRRELTDKEHNASIKRKFQRLAAAENVLMREYPIRGSLKDLLFVQRVRIVRWAIIQHYGMCQTPLLDLTHSLRIAASFASEGGRRSTHGEGFLFVLAVPQISGVVTVDVENGVQLVRLSAVCPPTAMRPHLQESYLIGEYPDLHQYDQKMLYPIEEVDFGQRLVAKFRFDVNRLWSTGDFNKINISSLTLKSDPFLMIASTVRAEARQRIPPR